MHILLCETKVKKHCKTLAANTLVAVLSPKGHSTLTSILLIGHVNVNLFGH
jgi:hypothetical protein